MLSRLAASVPDPLLRLYFGDHDVIIYYAGWRSCYHYILFVGDHDIIIKCFSRSYHGHNM